MRIILPVPDECSSIDEYFEQLELCVYHAKKSWERMKKEFTEEELKDVNVQPWVCYRIPELQRQYDDFGYKIIDNQLDQEIEIEISKP